MIVHTYICANESFQYTTSFGHVMAFERLDSWVSGDLRHRCRSLLAHIRPIGKRLLDARIQMLSPRCRNDPALLAMPHENEALRCVQHNLAALTCGQMLLGVAS